MADDQYLSPPPTEPAGPKDLSHHFSRVTAARQESRIKSFYKYFAIPGIGNLAGGLPNASFFPYDTLEAQIAQPERFSPTPNDPHALSTSLAATTLEEKKKPDTQSSAHLTVPHASSQSNPLRKIDLTTALQYGTAQGYPPIYSFLRTFARESLHPNIPYAGGAEIILSCGNTDGLAKTLEALSNVWSEEKDWRGEREGLLVEEFAYMNAVQGARPRGLNIVPVKMDGVGMLASGPGGLADVLENWDVRMGKRPHLMYTVTIGQNPTGGTLTVERRKELYALCSQYDVIIIEDDPYWYLQFPSAALLESQSRGLPLPACEAVHTFAKSSGYPFLDSLTPSYLSLDPDGRVVRLDTFSKTVAPGCRLGWITAQPALIERILRIAETSTQQPSGFVQSMIAELIMGPQSASSEFKKLSRKEQKTFAGWQTDGWVRWLEGLRGVYERRMGRMCAILDQGRFTTSSLVTRDPSTSDWSVVEKKEMYSFSYPRGGMFVWVRMSFQTHPLSSKVPGADLATALWIFGTREPYRVLSAPGAMFSPTDEIRAEEGYKYFRLCFAAVSEEEVDASSKRWAEGVKAFWEIRRRADLPTLDSAMKTGEGGEVCDLGMLGAC